MPAPFNWHDSNRVTFFNDLGIPQGKLSRILKEQNFPVLDWSPNLRQSLVQETLHGNSEPFTWGGKKEFSTLFMLYGTLCKNRTKDLGNEGSFTSEGKVNNFNHPDHHFMNPALYNQSTQINRTISDLVGLTQRDDVLSIQRLPDPQQNAFLKYQNISSKLTTYASQMTEANWCTLYAMMDNSPYLDAAQYAYLVI